MTAVRRTVYINFSSGHVLKGLDLGTYGLDLWSYGLDLWSYGLDYIAGPEWTQYW